METEQAADQLDRVFAAYPNYREWTRTASDDPAETICVWCEMLSKCDARDVTAIVDKIVAGELEPTSRYEKPDAMPRNIRTAANEIRSKRNERKHQQRYHQGASSGALDFVRADRTGHIAINIGASVRRGEITKEENDARMIELMNWDKGGSLPAWMADQATEGE